MIRFGSRSSRFKVFKAGAQALAFFCGIDHTDGTDALLAQIIISQEVREQIFQKYFAEA